MRLFTLKFMVIYNKEYIYRVIGLVRVRFWYGRRWNKEHHSARIHTENTKNVRSAYDEWV